MRKFLGIGVLLSVVALGLFAYDYFVLSSLERRLDASIREIETAYADIVDTDVASLRAAVPDPPSELSDAFGAASLFVERIDEPRDRLLRLNDITKLQRALRKIEALAAGIDALNGVPAFASLQHAIGERGEARGLLQIYNEHARQWNLHVQSTVSTASATVTSTERAMLPYLRFDGEAEAEQRVGFGG